MQSFNADITEDTRAPIEQMRRSDLLKIVQSKGLKVADTATKAQLMAILNANDISVNFETLVGATKPAQAAAPRVNHDADLAEFKEDLKSAKWFTLKKLADEYGAEIPPKGTPDRADVLRAAIIEAVSG